MDELSDLVERARAGDRQAFGRLYERLARPVLLHLVSLLGRTDDAEDALQTSFLKAWRKLGQLRRGARFTPWLFRIARRTALDLARSRPRGPTAPSVETLEAASKQDLTEELADVRRAVAELRPGTRTLVLLRVVGGWTSEAVADAVGLHPATVRRRYARALAHLREKLKRSETHGAAC